MKLNSKARETVHRIIYLFYLKKHVRVCMFVSKYVPEALSGISTFY